MTRKFNLLVITLLLSSFTLIAASNNTTSIKGRLSFPPDGSFDTQISLNGGKYIVFPSSNGDFTFNQVPIGTYILEVLHPEWVFPLFLIEVAPNRQNNAVVAVAYTYDAVQGKEARKNLPIEIRYIGKMELLKKKPGIDIIKFFKNPMVIMGIVCLIGMKLTPYLESMKAAEEARSAMEAENQPTEELVELSPFEKKLSG